MCKSILLSCLLITILILSGCDSTQLSKNEDQKVEAPSSFTLDSAMDRTLNSAFTSRAAFIRQMQSVHVAKNAYLNLLPHLSINSILSVATASDYLGYLKAAGDLVPFLFPTRWIQAKNAKILSDAEKYALAVMRGDSGLQVHSLAYTWNKNKSVIEEYSQTIIDTEKLTDQIEVLENLGQFPAGTSAMVQSEVNALKMDRILLQGAWEEGRSTVSQAMGFINPSAVELIDIGIQEIPKLDDLPSDSSKTGDLAIQRSLELQQMKDLIRAAENAKTATYFQWLDPSGNMNAGLGFGLGEAVKIARDRVRELNVQREALESSIQVTSTNALIQYHNAEERLRIAEDDKQLQERRYKRLLQNIQFGKGTTQLELVAAIRERLRSRVIAREATAGLFVARAKIDRVLLLGFYSKLGI